METKKDLINKICQTMLKKGYYIDYNPIGMLLNMLNISTLGDILADIKYESEE